MEKLHRTCADISFIFSLVYKTERQKVTKKREPNYCDFTEIIH